MIVLGLVAALVALAVPKLTGQNNQIRQAVRKISSLGRQLHNSAMMNGAMYRLVIDLKTDSSKDKQEYWVEVATSQNVLRPEEMAETLAEREKREQEKRESKKDSDSKSEEEQKLFTVDTKILKKPETLPGSLTFEDVEFRRSNNPFKEGRVYIYFSPQGLADEAVIHLKANEKLRWSLALRPLTGKTEVITEYISLKALHE
ncbi:MAG: hypothetical protein K1X29_03065 [Bdellovibrionales bacterium]|nr:hypothetical protein [Bdellovibrionales bacterium]